MDQKQLKALVNRRHPEYVDRAKHWDFLKSCYEGGRDWFKENIFRYLKEGDKEHTDRLARAYRFNHTKEVVDLVDKYLFKMEVVRDESRAPDSVKEFWKDSTLAGLPVKDFSRRISNLTSIYGRIWIVVDNTNDDSVESVADEKESESKTFAYVVPPQAALDMSYDDKGQLNWILLHEVVRDDADPFVSSGIIVNRFRLWTRTSWQLFTIIPKAGSEGKEYDVLAGPQVPHTLGVVPVFAADNVVSEELYSSPSLIDDVAYLDRAVSNYLSNLDAIIQDQSFSQLAMPAQGMLPGDNAYDKVLELGTKRIFMYDGEDGTQPFYLSPDVKQAEIILKVINKIINEIYHTVGLAGERTKEDNALGIDNSSGVAKAYDFERVNSLLASKADALETIENRLVHLVALWNGEEIEDEVRLVQYPDNFDVRGLYDEFEIATQLLLIEAPDTVRRTQMDAVIDKLFPKLADDLKKKMELELKTWPPKIDPLTGMSSNGKPGKVAASLQKPKPAAK